MTLTNPPPTPSDPSTPGPSTQGPSTQGPPPPGPSTHNPSPAPQLSHREILTVFAGLMTGMLLAALDGTILATALPTIVGELGGLDRLSWVVTAYLLTTTAVTPLYGKLSDLYGRKLLFQAAIVIFVGGSVLCGLAQDMTQLVIFRGIQGIGGGGLMAMAFAIIGDVVSPRERGRYTGYLGSVFAFASVIGPFLGGFIVDSLSWRWVFFVNVPVGVVAMVVTSAVLKMPVTRREHSIDWLGATLLVAGVSVLMLALVWGGDAHAWGSPTIVGLLVGSVALAGAFLAWEQRAAEPILPLRLFGDRVFAVTSTLAVLVGAAMYGGIVFLPLFLQAVTGASATDSGLLLLPLMAGMMLTSITSGRIIVRTGRYKVWPVTGMGIASVGMVLLSTMDASTGRLESSAYMLLLGVGLGMVMQVLILAAQNSAEFADLGVVSSAINFFRSLGGSIGVAVFGALLAARLGPELVRRLPTEADVVDTDAAAFDTSTLANSPEQIRALPPAVADAVSGAIEFGVQGVFRAAVPLLVLGFALAWLLPEKPLRTTVGGPTPSAPTESEPTRSGA
jgi:EmrB/QacA subfamily drug resistance transporter